MRKLGAFLQLWGYFDDPLTYLVWPSLIGIWVLPMTDWRWYAMFAVEAITVAVRIWTRDVTAEKRRKKEKT